jgi:hypothetical protein
VAIKPGHKPLPDTAFRPAATAGGETKKVPKGVESPAGKGHNCAMPHKFQPGDKVYLLQSAYLRNAAPGIYEVVRQMPEQAGEFIYRIKNERENYERAAKESQLEKVP